jgi:capsular polysaccharide biosynthesis protein
VIDELPNLLRMREDRPDFNNVLVHKLTSRWAIELLEFYKFNVLVLDEKSVIIEELILVSAPRVVVGKNLELLRRNVQSSPNQIVIVSRKGSPRSDNLIEEALQSQIPNSKLIDPSDYPIQQQIEIFSQASVVIGLHGGALTNAVWMDCSGKLIEIFNHAYRTSDYQRLCLELGISYVGIDALEMVVEQIVLSIRTQLND